jgi:lipopolysaccharide transport system ATP-binding protein
MSSDVVIEARSLSKCYRLWRSPAARLKSPLLAAAAEGMQHRGPLANALWRKAHTYFSDFYALREVSLSIRRGEVVGVIGRNGCGKSTLLQILAGTLHPTTGTREVRGKVAAILELGCGFNAELTGRENVRMAATLEGLAGREREQLIERSAEFADIGKFFDQPVRKYSSGMFVRLAFAASIAVEPDVLLVDEALAVGDTLFQSRCYRKMEELRARGTTILLVSHDVYTVQSFCDRAVLLEAGQLAACGTAKEVVHRYTELITTHAGAAPAGQAAATGEYRFGRRAAEIVSFALLNEQQQPVQQVDSGAVAIVRLAVRFHEAVATPVVGFAITTPTGMVVAATNTWYEQCEPGAQPAGAALVFEFRMALPLAAGRYVLNVAVAAKQPDMVEQLDCRQEVLSFTILETRPLSAGVVNLRPQISWRQEGATAHV